MSMALLSPDAIALLRSMADGDPTAPPVALRELEAAGLAGSLHVGPGRWARGRSETRAWITTAGRERLRRIEVGRRRAG